MFASPGGGGGGGGGAWAPNAPATCRQLIIGRVSCNGSSAAFMNISYEEQTFFYCNSVMKNQ